jgi:SpoIID/LytB domain protein
MNGDLTARIRFWAIASAMATIVVLSLSSPATAADEDWIIEGGGWGHGIGLSQYGAYGMALDGFEAPDILAHYYSGAISVAASDSLGTDHWIFEEEALWIGLKDDADTVDLGAVNGDLSVCQKGDGTDDCAVVDLVIPSGATWRFEAVPESVPIRCQFIETSTEIELPEGDCIADVTWVDNVNLDDLPSVTRVEIDGGREYAHGTIRVRPNNATAANADAFHVALSIGLEDYVYGIGEVPSSWHEAVLETQAIIARGFGVAAATSRAPTGELPTYRINRCWCHLVATSADQNFVGWQKESEGIGAQFGKRWVAAVDATAGTVVTHPSTGDKIISTWYSSSTGGATENNEDVWGGSPRAYARSVDDHWATGPQVHNPYATWTAHVSTAAVLAALNEGWDTVVSARLTAGPPGTIVEFTGSDNGSEVTTTRNGNWFRSKFSVRSPYVSAVIAPGTIPPFVDIGGSIHYDSIAFIWQNGITKGCNPPANDRFCPDGNVTRGQMSAFLNRALALPPSSNDHFVDDGDSIFEGDINRLAEAGITKGCNPPDNDRFCPDAKVTRGQMAAFLVRAFGYTDTGGGDLFIDDDGLVFEDDIDRLGTAGITKGCNPPTNSRFCPGEVLNRAEMAAFLHRALG